MAYLIRFNIQDHSRILFSEIAKLFHLNQSLYRFKLDLFDNKYPSHQTKKTIPMNSHSKVYHYTKPVIQSPYTSNPTNFEPFILRITPCIASKRLLKPSTKTSCFQHIHSKKLINSSPLIHRNSFSSEQLRCSHLGQLYCSPHSLLRRYFLKV